MKEDNPDAILQCNDTLYQIHTKKQNLYLKYLSDS